MISKRVERMIDNLNLMDDYFMTMVFDDNAPAAERIINIIMDKKDTKVTKIQVQKTIKNSKVNGRSVIFDVNSKDIFKNLYDFEFQNNKKGAGKKRSRFYSSALDMQMLKSGQDFSELKDSYVIFFTQADVMKKGLPLYHIQRSVLETKEVFKDGNHIIYVNGAYKDETTPIGKLVHDLKCTKADDMYYEELRDAVRYFKENEGGRAKMSKTIEDYMKENWRNGKKIGIKEGKKEGRKEGKKEGRKEGIKLERRNTVRNMNSLGFDVKIIAEVVGMPEKTVEEWMANN